MAKHCFRPINNLYYHVNHFIVTIGSIISAWVYTNRAKAARYVIALSLNDTYIYIECKLEMGDLWELAQRRVASTLTFSNARWPSVLGNSLPPLLKRGQRLNENEWEEVEYRELFAIGRSQRSLEMLRPRQNSLYWYLHAWWVLPFNAMRSICILLHIIHVFFIYIHTYIKPHLYFVVQVTIWWYFNTSILLGNAFGFSSFLYL